MRGKGEGALFRVPADRKKPLKYWTVVVELPPVDGTRRRKVVRRKDKTAALAELAKLQQELAARGDLPTKDQTVAQWFTYWLTLAERDVRPKTHDGYRAVVKHVIDAIGTVKLSKVTATHIRRVHTHMENKGFSSTYQLLAHRVMAVSFKQAVREGRIGRNPAELTKAPRKRTPQLEALTLEESLDVIRAVANEPDGARWIVHLLTGARRGEVLGLEVDRIGDTLDLSWQLQRLNDGATVPADFERRHLIGGLWLTRPKSKAGWRVVPLVDPLRTVLERHIATTESNTWGLVFSRNGRPYDPDQVSKEWREVLTRVGIEKNIRLHDLRHTAVDLLLMAGVPEDVVMEIVGHSTRATTRAYKSRNSPRLRAAMQDLADMLTQAEGTRRELGS